MAWGSDTTATQLTSIGTTEQFFSFGGSTKITLNPGEEIHIQLAADFPASPTDQLRVAIYTTLDDTSEVWDLVPYQTFDIGNNVDPNRISCVVGDIYAFRIGVKSSGTTDTITSADASYRKNGLSL